MSQFTGTQTFKMVVKQDGSGEVGLMFEDCPLLSEYPMVTTEGLLVAHDLLEHVSGLGKIGSLDDELKAMGAVWFVRGQHGVIRKGSQHYSPQDSLASDVLNMATIYNNGVNFRSPVPEIDQDHEWFEEFQEIVNGVRESISEELEDEEIDQDRIDYYLNSALAYMLEGYDLSVERYKHVSDYTVFEMFFQIAEEVDKKIKEFELFEGQEFEITVNLSDRYCLFSEFFDEEYFEDEDEDEDEDL